MRKPRLQTPTAYPTLHCSESGTLHKRSQFESTLYYVYRTYCNAVVTYTVVCVQQSRDNASEICWGCSVFHHETEMKRGWCDPPRVCVKVLPLCLRPHAKVYSLSVGSVCVHHIYSHCSTLHVCAYMCAFVYVRGREQVARSLQRYQTDTLLWQHHSLSGL